VRPLRTATAARADLSTRWGHLPHGPDCRPARPWVQDSRNVKPRILFSSTCKPFELVGGVPATDNMGMRLTRGQGLFSLYEHTHYNGLHLLAQNVSAGSVVLENPSLDRFRQELREGYEYVGLSFKPINTERLLEMCAIVRRESPGAKILVGGQGATCAPFIFKDSQAASLADGVCAGEGVAWLRRVLGEPPAAGLRCRLPKIGAALPWLSPRPLGTIGIALSGLGCTMNCHFCYTANATGGRYLEVMDAAQLFETMRGYWESSPLASSVSIYDENFLDYREKVLDLGKRIQSDGKFGLARLNYLGFGSISAVARYDPEELLLSGLDTLWIGVESKFSSLPKGKGMGVEDAFRLLHSIGIKTVGSWMIGEDFQTPENIGEDKDFFVSLDPTFQQVAILSVLPPLPLYRSLQRKGRIPPGVRWKDYHLYGRTLEYRHLRHEEILGHVEDVYRRVYEENGPGMMKVLEVNLNGYAFCLRSRNPLLRKDKSRFFRKRCESYRSLLETARAFAPSPRVRSRLEELDSRYQDLFGRPTRAQRNLARLVLAKAEAEMARRRTSPRPLREEPFRRYTYPPLAERAILRPYRVEYPEGDPCVDSAASDRELPPAGGRPPGRRGSAARPARA